MGEVMASALYEQLEKISDRLDMQLTVANAIGADSISVNVEDAKELLYMVNKRLYDIDHRKAMRVK